MRKMWKKVLLVETETPDTEALIVVGECKRCGRCCVCWFYDIRDQPACIPPRRGWCPDLDLEAKRCRIWKRRPEGCRNFPTMRDFELGAVPGTCGFRLAKGSNGGDSGGTG
jgi:uncharacterized cysteine cluster protein YcgN (CxxCxxCC family)